MAHRFAISYKAVNPQVHGNKVKSVLRSTEYTQNTWKNKYTICIVMVSGDVHIVDPYFFLGLITQHTHPPAKYFDFWEILWKNSSLTVTLLWVKLVNKPNYPLSSLKCPQFLAIFTSSNKMFMMSIYHTQLNIDLVYSH